MIKILIYILIIILCIIINNKKIDRYDVTIEKAKEIEQNENIKSLFDVDKKNIIANNLEVKDGMDVNNLIVNTLDIIPDGVIIAYKGDKIPDGWVLCDGKTYTTTERGKKEAKTIKTPNLVDKYLIGDMKAGTYGGLTELILNEIHLPPHQHQYNLPAQHVRRGVGQGGPNSTCVSTAKNCNLPGINIWTQLSIATAGYNLPIKLIPASYTVLYLQRFAGFKH